MSAPALIVLTEHEARLLTDRLKAAVEMTWALVREAYVSRAWAVLGYRTWDDYCLEEFDSYRLRLPLEELTDVVLSLRDAGLSVRAIAAATGTSRGTVCRALPGVPNGTPASVTGIDGKVYESHREPKAEPERVEDIVADAVAELRAEKAAERAENQDARSEFLDHLRRVGYRPKVDCPKCDGTGRITEEEL